MKTMSLDYRFFGKLIQLNPNSSPEKEHELEEVLNSGLHEDCFVG
jgi:hypothetical protein